MSRCNVLLNEKMVDDDAVSEMELNFSADYISYYSLIVSKFVKRKVVVQGRTHN